MVKGKFRFKANEERLFRRAKDDSMRCTFALLVTLALAACGTTQVSPGQPQAASPGQVPASQQQIPSTDSPMEFLLTACATDFHAHRPPNVMRFRDVRFGHGTTPAGAKQYRLCGEFLSAQQDGKAEWTPFVTIKTSGYEQWNGATAASMCQRSQFVSDNDADLSTTLQSRLDSQR